MAETPTPRGKCAHIKIPSASIVVQKGISAQFVPNLVLKRPQGVMLVKQTFAITPHLQGQYKGQGPHLGRKCPFRIPLMSSDMM